MKFFVKTLFGVFLFFDISKTFSCRCVSLDDLKKMQDRIDHNGYRREKVAKYMKPYGSITIYKREVDCYCPKKILINTNDENHDTYVVSYASFNTK